MWPVDQSPYSFQKVYCLFYCELDQQGMWLSSLYFEWLLSLLLFMMWVEKYLVFSVLVGHGPGEARWDSPYKTWYAEAPEPPSLSISLLLSLHQTLEGQGYPNIPEESTWSVWKGSGSNFLFYIISPKGHRVDVSWEPLGLPLGVSLADSVHRVLAGFGGRCSRGLNSVTWELEYGMGRTPRLVSSHTFFLHRRAELTFLCKIQPIEIFWA